MSSWTLKGATGNGNPILVNGLSRESADRLAKFFAGYGDNVTIVEEEK